MRRARSKRYAQAALEFLMTYGWAIGIITIAVIALANFDALNLDAVVSPEKCTAGYGAECADSNINENTVRIALRNTLGEDIKLTSIKIGDCNAANLGILKNGQEKVYDLSGCENIPATKFEDIIEGYYLGENGISHPIKGILSGKVQPGTSIAIGTFFRESTEKKDFDKGSYDNTEATPDGKVRLAPGQQSGKYKSSGRYTSKIYDGYSANADWTDITLGKEAPYQEEIGRAFGDTEGASKPYADTSGLSVAAHFNKEEENGETDELIKDFSGNDNNAKCAGNSCPAYDSDDKKLGDKAIKFDGIDDVLEHSQNQEDFNNKKFTVETWAKIEQTDSGSSWSTAVVDSSGNVGADNSIKAVDANNIVAGYQDNANKDLKFAKSNDNGNTWITTVVDNGGDTGADVGADTSIDAVNANIIVISYKDNTNQDLKFAKSTDGGSTWPVIATVDSGGDTGADVGADTSIDAVNANIIVISYKDDTGQDLKFAKSTNGGSTWITTVVDSGGDAGADVGADSSIQVVDANTIVISYKDNTNQDLKFAKSSDNGNTWVTTVVDSAGDVGTDTSIKVIDAGTIVISYQDASNQDLKFVKSTDGGSTWPVIATVDSAGDVGTDTSIDAVDVNTIVISYKDNTNQDLKFAKSTDGGSTWPVIATVDSAGDVGTDTSIKVVDADTVVVSYQDATNQYLKFAKSQDDAGYIKDFRDAENKNAPSLYYDNAEKKFVVSDGVNDIIKYDKLPLASEWFHITATMDFASDNYKLYYDGKDVSAGVVGEEKSIIHTTDSDFSAGTFYNAAVNGIFSPAYLSLKVKRPTHSFSYGTINEATPDFSLNYGTINEATPDFSLNYGTINEATPDGYAPCSATGTDHKGDDWSPTGTISGDHCNVGKFEVSGNVIAGGTLRVFTQEAVIAGTLSADGKGYGYESGPGKGYSGGYNSYTGSGAGYGGVGWGNKAGITYGSLANPIDLGSGGGGNFGSYGGSGGGAIFLNVINNIAIDGTISANGDQGKKKNGGGGSGGSIWIIASALSGKGTIQADGGKGAGTSGGGGGGGRIAVYYDSDSSSVSYRAYGGNNAYGTDIAGTGTIFLKPKKSGAGNYGTLKVVNALQTSGSSAQTPINSIVTISNFILGGGAWATLSSGVNGAGDGEFSLSSGIATLEIPKENIIDFKTIDIPSGTTLYTSNSDQGETLTYSLNLEADSATINGLIIADGKGYGSRSGPGEGYYAGGGAGYGGVGGENTATRGITYGSLTNPLDIGSGGGNNGGSGGGAIFLNVINSIAIDGTISANGVKSKYTSEYRGGGSGGSIWIIASALSGKGTIQADGGDGVGGRGGGGSGGRIAVYYDSDSSSVSYHAYGGTKANALDRGGAGTIFLKPKKSGAGNYGTLKIVGKDIVNAQTPISSKITISNLIIGGGAWVTLSSDVNAAGDGEFSLSSGIATLEIPKENIIDFKTIDIPSGTTLYTSNSDQGDTPTYSLNLEADSAIIQGSIIADGKGYGYSKGPGKGHYTGGGGGYGGVGGEDTATSGITYGSLTNPLDIGSGGGNNGGSGGGAIFLNVINSIAIDGTISANGVKSKYTSEYRGGGSGGSIWIIASALSGKGTIQADGGDGYGGRGGGGGGGRIAAYYDSDSSSVSYHAYGGVDGDGADIAGAGTIFLKPKKSGAGNYGTLKVVNALQTSGSSAQTPINSIVTISNFILGGGAWITLSSGVNGAGDGEFSLSSGTAILEIPKGNILDFKTINIPSGTTLYTGISDQKELHTYSLNLEADSATIQGSIIADGRGYGSNQGPGEGSGSNGGGAGYGGVGGKNTATSGITYGSLTNPIDLGSGGGSSHSYTAGSGGGAIFLNVINTLAIDGTISANGVKSKLSSESRGGGSGGSIWIIASSLSGKGIIQADGGDGGNKGGGGGGGRIAVYYDSDSSFAYHAYGGASFNTKYYGETGTTFISTWQESTNEYESLGTLTSSPIDTNAERLDFMDISWNADTPSGTSIKFQLAYSPDGSNWFGFYGHDGTSNTYFTPSDKTIPSKFDGNRYIKYKLFLESSDSTKTPKLNDITIKYRALPYISSVGTIGAIGASNTAAGDKLSWNGLLDETILWNRILSSEEVLEHYKRGALDLYVEVRSCDDPNCDGESFTGHYTQQGVNTINIPKNRYFQYRVNFETDDDSYSPVLEEIKLSYTVA